MSFPFYKQLNTMDCGPTCLRMVAKHFGKHYNLDTLRQKIGVNKEGVSLLGISEIAEKIGFRTRYVQIDVEKLEIAPHPAILHWNQNHFVVLISLNNKKAKIADPAKGIVTYDLPEFTRLWASRKNNEGQPVGTVLLMEPSPVFHKSEGEKENKVTWAVVTQYLRQSRGQLIQIFISLIISAILQLLLPYLTQSLVDIGINTRNLQFITIILIAQLTLTFSSTVIGFIRNRLQLRVSNSINIAILSDFWSKLTRLPVSYFDTHHTGDTIQRIDDNKKIQYFLTSETMNTLFSSLTLIVYSIALVTYSVKLFLVFLGGNVLYILWIQLFLRVRRKINYETFYISAKENNATLELVQGMQEIRLNNAEKSKRWAWENIQANVFKLNFKNLNYTQWQSTGAMFISQSKDIFITYIVAQLVVSGEVTFGTMLAVQYIIGQLNGPVSQFIALSQSVQDAKISLERINEIHQMPDEEPEGITSSAHLPNDKKIILKDFSFAYPGVGNDLVLDKLNLVIPEGKVTAIVGISGSGKTTLLKILLKIYDQYEGELYVGETKLNYISPSFWRSQCGVVLQDGYIFNDNIAGNIAVGEEYIDYEKLFHSCKVANILSFIETLPNGFNTKLGVDGVGISQGQRQRLLIARAVYKDPQYLFFDEATNALDVNNEKTIVENLHEFYQGRTVVVVAHRLSTVRNAEKIVVLNAGKIVEEGTHEHLISIRGFYYELVKNQLN